MHPARWHAAVERQVLHSVLLAGDAALNIHLLVLAEP